MFRVAKYIKKLMFSVATALRGAAYSVLGAVDKNVLKRTNPIVILSYHSVASDDWRFSVDAKTVKKQVTYLKKHFTIITLSELTDHLQGKKTLTKPSAVLTFDDGYKDVLELKDFFTKNKIKPALFLLANTKTPNWKELGTKRPFLNKTEIKKLVKAGWEIGCHSATHANLATLSDKMLQDEVVTAKKALEKELGMPIQYFAYPRGKYTQNVVKFIKKAKYQLALTMDDGFIKPDMDVYRIPRVGVDRTHSFAEFKTAYSPSVVQFRQVIKMSPIGRYL